MSEEEKGNESAQGRKSLSPDEAKVLVEGVVSEAMKKMGYALGDDGKPDFSKVPEGDIAGKIPEMVLQMFQTAMDREKAAAGSGGVSVSVPDNAPGPDPVAQERQAASENREPSAFERQIQGSLRQAMEEYLTENVIEPNKADDVQIDVDAAFLKDHGGPILSTLVSAFAKSILPDELSVEVPVSDDDDGEGQKKKVKMALDFGKLFQSMLDKAKKGPGGDEESAS